ncbi:MAG: ATP-dependent Clp protease proteolytic subunit [Oscillospiraceae bacterium]|nr:ATP-dependent Clp protease proteolytic subunit [Oscillospiraceae bacterium]MBQ4545426.1 ATP-dependent Clp protease proteolytic subunit [Oscillospiraceae bacterium]MBQ6901522.1 ATP-dependent Clp protease proteolytic subunit [Oscillospiraceae bacterium]
MSDSSDNKKETREEMIETGSIVATSKYGNIHCITIIGQIEGHTILSSDTKTTKYEHICPTLAAVEEREDVDGLLIMLNTVGGDIEAGLAIAELIAGMTKPTASLILGGGHSIGVPLAVAAKHSIIAETAAITIHPVRMSGVVVGAPQTFNYFERVQDRITSFVERHSNISAEKFREYMLKVGELATDVGTVIYGKEAVDIGLIDRVGTLNDALSFLHTEIEKNKNEKST